VAVAPEHAQRAVEEFSVGDVSSNVWQRWFGRKRTEAPAPPAGGPVLGVLGNVLKEYVEWEIELEDPEARRRLSRLDAYARDVVKVDDQSPANDDAPPTPPPDWEGLRATFSKHRRAERSFVQQTVSGFKQALVDVAQALTRALDGDKEGDARVSTALSGLRDLAETPTVDVRMLRRSVLEAVEVVEAATVERSQRHQREVGRLRDVLRTMRVELKRAHEMAETDALTGLANRASLDQHLTGTAAIGAFRGHATTLLLLDLDHFKRVNDTYGHPGGDAVLRAVAETLKGFKLRETDLVARYGGEEFAVVLHDCDQGAAFVVAERIRRAVEGTAVVHEGEIARVTVSVGVAERGLEESPKTWVERTDRALYSAKQKGRNRVEVAAPALVGPS